MKLDNHVAYEYLTKDDLAWDVVWSMYPGIRKLKVTADESTWTEDMHKAAQLYKLVNRREQRAYYVTESVLDKLDMLLVKRNSPGKVIDSLVTRTILEEVQTYDWSVFKRIQAGTKVTFIFPDNFLVRMTMTVDGVLSFMDLRAKEDSLGLVNTEWTLFFLNTNTNEFSQNWTSKDVAPLEDFLYRLLCFFYLSENEEVIVEPGEKHGTRKSGKVINNLPVPVTVVTSKWNVTSIRTEGFDVSGHFRLQPTKQGIRNVYVHPYQKHGYIRRAKKDDSL